MHLISIMSAMNIITAANNLVKEFLQELSVINDGIPVNSTYAVELWQEEWEEKFKKVIQESVKESKPKRQKRAKKPKNAPKNPKTSYIFYCQEKRPEVKEEKPDLNTQDILRELGALWKEVDDEEKEKYKKMAEDDKERYKNEMENYDPNQAEEEKPKKERKKKVKGAPKNPRTAYNFFCTKNREEFKEENPDLDGKEITKKLGEAWKQIKDTHQADEYKNMAEDDKIRHKEEMENFVPGEEKEKDVPPAPKKKGRKPKKVEIVVEEEEEETEETIVRKLFEDNDTVTKKKVKEVLKEKGFNVNKEQLNNLIKKIQE